jgi:copper homeostasis protein
VTPLALEVIVSSLDDAIAAAAGGAHRLEVVRELSIGGLTPAVELVRQIQEQVPLPLRVMVRGSAGFTSTSDECRMLVEHASAFAALGVDGIVVGWTREGRIDDETLSRVLEAAPSLPATFHHAFDTLADPERALRHLKQYTQIDRVLTRGGDGEWSSRCGTLSQYARWAAPQITVLPGGGIDAAALRALAACGAIGEAHVGRAARYGASVDGTVSTAAVRALRQAAGWERYDGEARR